MSARDDQRCADCGHPQHCHRFGPAAMSGSPCVATVYEHHDHGPETSGMSAYPCPCRRFRAVSGQETP